MTARSADNTHNDRCLYVTCLYITYQTTNQHTNIQTKHTQTHSMALVISNFASLAAWTYEVLTYGAHVRDKRLCVCLCVGGQVQVEFSANKSHGGEDGTRFHPARRRPTSIPSPKTPGAGTCPLVRLHRGVAPSLPVYDPGSLRPEPAAPRILARVLHPPRGLQRAVALQGTYIHRISKISIPRQLGVGRRVRFHTH